MKRAIIIGTILIFAAFIFVFLGNFFRIDDCLDRGGRWNYRAKQCEFKTEMSLSENSSWTLDKEYLVQVEAHLRMPLGASQVSDYYRFYAGFISDENQMIKGTFVANRDLAESLGMHTSDEQIRVFDRVIDLPVIFDGGCNVIDLIWDIQYERAIVLRCHGVA